MHVTTNARVDRRNRAGGVALPFGFALAAALAAAMITVMKRALPGDLSRDIRRGRALLRTASRFAAVRDGLHADTHGANGHACVACGAPIRAMFVNASLGHVFKVRSVL